MRNSLGSCMHNLCCQRCIQMSCHPPIIQPSILRIIHQLKSSKSQFFQSSNPPELQTFDPKQSPWARLTLQMELLFEISELLPADSKLTLSCTARIFRTLPQLPVHPFTQKEKLAVLLAKEYASLFRIHRGCPKCLRWLPFYHFPCEGKRLFWDRKCVPCLTTSSNPLFG